MKKKICFKCNTSKSLTEFYKHPQMADGHLNKCIECAKIDVRKNYRKFRSDKQIYDQIRNQRTSRKLARLDHQRRRRANHPEKMRAYNMVARALRNGSLVKPPCEVCGELKVQAHHHDYNKPLDVRWLCFKCHREVEHGQQVR